MRKGLLLKANYNDELAKPNSGYQYKTDYSITAFVGYRPHWSRLPDVGVYGHRF